eukprot:45391_1
MEVKKRKQVETTQKKCPNIKPIFLLSLNIIFFILLYHSEFIPMEQKLSTNFNEYTFHHYEQNLTKNDCDCTKTSAILRYIDNRHNNQQYMNRNKLLFQI